MTQNHLNIGLIPLRNHFVVSKPMQSFSSVYNHLPATPILLVPTSSTHLT